MGGTGPNRSRFRLSVKTAPRSEADHDENWREALRAYPESLINLDVGAKLGYVGPNYSVDQGVVTDNFSGGFNRIYEDEYGFESTSPLGRLVVPRGFDGRYLCIGRAQAAANQITGNLLLLKFFAANGSNWINMDDTYPGSGVVSGNSARFRTYATRYFNVGDAIGMAHYHESAGAVSFVGNDEIANDIDFPAPTLEMWRIAVRG